jgi:hypothetical protein
MIHGIRAEHKDRYGDPVTWINMDNMDDMDNMDKHE